MSRRFATALGFGLLLSLCHCATKHQPIEFAPYFPTRPDVQLRPEHLGEIRGLENKPSLNGFEKKRLLDLYSLELKGLKPGSPRTIAIGESSQRLQADIAGLDQELKEVLAKVRLYKEPSSTSDRPVVAFENVALRKAYGEAYHLWNRDQNDLALKKVAEILKNPSFREGASKAEWYRVNNLKFRIALDTADRPTSEAAFLDMKNLESCGADTANAAFLLALHRMASGDLKAAAELYSSQCDPDKSPSNLIKHKYWGARFREGDPTSIKLYEELSNAKLPGYYGYLARLRTGKPFVLPPAETGPKAYLSHELSVSREVATLMGSAEARLRAGLRKDASIFLVRASHLLKKDVDESKVLPLLYTAHCLQAAGNHLEAMRIYSVITTALQEDSSTLATLEMDFLAEMFPRPFLDKVEWLSRQWNADPDFIYSIMRQESAFNPGAVSMVDARGLMQLMPSLARSLSKSWSYQAFYSDKMLFIAEENLKLAVFHLHQLRTLAPHLVLMTASYNAGLNRVSGWWRKFGDLPLDVFIELIPVNETRNYVKLVMRNYIFYKALRAGGTLEGNPIPFKLPPYPGAPAQTTVSKNLTPRT